MSESTLSVSRNEIRQEVAFYLGFGRTESKWSAARVTEIDQYVKEGLRQFYFPEVIQVTPGQSLAHRWSFLEPEATLDTVVGQEDYDMPDDFGSLINEFTFSADEVAGQRPISMVSAPLIRRSRQQDVGSQRPTAWALAPKASTGASGQRYKVMLWPAPDQIYTLNYQYSVLPNMLTGPLPYPLGGAAFGQTILASCLAIAEQKGNKESTIHRQEFLRRMKASVSEDMSRAPRNFGYAGDRSSGASRRRWGRNDFYHNSYTTTVGGVTPGS